MPDTVIETYGLEKALSIILYEMTWFGWSLDKMEIDKYLFHYDNEAPLPDEFFMHDQETRTAWEEERLTLSPEEAEEQKRRKLLAAVRMNYRFLQLADRVAKEIRQG